MANPSWLTKAIGYIGVRETDLPQHANPEILRFLDEADGKLDGKRLEGISNDIVPWCATFVSAVLEECGIVSARSAWARSYLDWGSAIPHPEPGAIVVFQRGQDASTGHVSFVAGRDAAGNLMCCGGNQGNMVDIAAFATANVLGYRWPKGQKLPPSQPLPLVAPAT